MPQPLGSYRSATELRPRETDASRSRNSRLAPYCLRLIQIWQVQQQ
jgi:hypothetical protein